MLSHTNILSTVKGVFERRERSNAETAANPRHCSFLPMAHLYERINLMYNLLNGSQIACCPIPEKIFEYYSIVKPTTISMVPRILNKVYDTIMAEVNKSKIKRFLILQALHYEKPSLFSRFIFRKVKNLFGGEVISMVTGSAPITPEVLHFFRIALDAPIIEAYGQTESTASGTTTHIADLSCGKVGSPGPVVEIKLIDVPGTNYRSNNNQGEVCIRGPGVFKGELYIYQLNKTFVSFFYLGYYGDEQKTRETIDEGGWLHTGDVGEWTNNGTLRIIDRTKHIFKLNQGEYIAPERLEDIYHRSRWINQIFVDGISTESTVVAIVIPDEEYVRQNLKTITSTTSFDEICNDEKLKEIILNDLKRLAKEYKFKYYETVSNIHLHSKLFSQENGLITSTLKTRRTAARQYFQNIIQSLYNVSEKITKPIDVEQQSKL
jgi:long-chain acyl-CoA synthetase